MADPSAGPSRLRRLASGWSVRAFLALIAMTALVLGWIELRVGPQRRAVRAILRCGGTVLYDWQFDGPVVGGTYNPSAPPRPPERLVRWLGEDYFGDVISVSVQGEGVDGALLDEIARLRGLQALHLYDARLDRSDLARIAGLVGLRAFSLGRCSVDDEALSQLRGLTGLVTLDLSRTPIDGSGLAHLGGMQDLQILYASWTSIDDRGLANLPALPGLRLLTLDGTRITDAGLAPLQRLPGLIKLDLARVHISDEGLKSIGAWTSPRILTLSDDGPAPHPTSDGVDALRRARPDLTVDFHETTAP